MRILIEHESERGPLHKLHKAFQTHLIHDLSEEGFADTYAQTLTYGLLTAAFSLANQSGGATKERLLASHLPQLVPSTNPFLRELLETFLKVGGRDGAIDFDELGIQDVVELLRSANTDLKAVIEDFGNKTRGEDPVIYFYERFLDAYNKQLKIQRGVFYTPQPVVSYIVRSVHELLQTEFGLADGLADTTTWGEMLQKHPDLKLPPLTDEPGETRTISPDEAFVQIVDPATGTATFLVEVIEVIHRTLMEKWKHLSVAQRDMAWNEYVPKHLLPRLHAFELMMAPYAIAHMKIGLKLAETGYRFGAETASRGSAYSTPEGTSQSLREAQDKRVRIYLTNALEPKVKQLPQIGFDALAHEAAAVNEIKWYKRFTVVIGNPPFAGESANPSEDSDGRPTFIGRLIRDYFWVDGEPLGERNSKWLHDDYAKFIRLSEFFIRQAGEGVLGYITNHSFIFNATFRGMRQHMLASFQRLDIANLHGSTKLKEQCPDGSADVNVFDIEPGVAIAIGMRCLGREQSLAYGDVWGSRESKYAKLNSSPPLSLATHTHQTARPFYLFFPQSSSLREEFMSGASLVDIFPLNNTGIITKRDDLTIHPTADSVWKTVTDFATCPRSEAYARFDLPDDVRDWSVERAQHDLKSTGLSRDRVCQIGYRPFDIRFSYYTGNARGFVGWPVEKVMKHMVSGQNVAICIGRAGQVIDSGKWNIIFCTRHMTEFNLFRRGGNVVFPLYLKPDKFTAQRTLGTDGEGKPNLSAAFISHFQKGLKASLNAEDVFHYIYAVFHSPGYRTRYAEFLKIDFPRLPLTGNLELFRTLARLGGELTALHLLESPKLDQPMTTFIGDSREVVKVGWVNNTVWLDAGGKKAETRPGTRGFQGVPEAVWNFHIGGYQVCEKWLKDRKGRTLSEEDIAHYHKIVVALSETIRLMAEIDAVIEAHGGWPGAFQGHAAEADSEPVLKVAEGD